MVGRLASRPKTSLTIAEARPIALAAQGFAARRGDRPSGWPTVAATIEQTGILQLDSVNALVRAHYLPVFSRRGPYRRADLDRRAFAPTGRTLFEYWAHEASLLPLGFFPLLRWRMRRARQLEGEIYRGLAEFVRANRAYVDSVRDEVAERGPLVVSQLSDPGKRGGPWWGWNRGKAAMEYLFSAGIVTAAGRRGFERIYDLTERALPDDVLTAPVVDDATAIRGLVGFAATVLGIATETDLRDYFRLPVADTRQAVAELVEAGAIEPVAVDGWRPTAYLAADAPQPRRSTATALISPFDPLIWYRQRAQRLFGIDFKLEFYVPAAKRQYGYCVLPFLHRGRFVARVDLQADRAAGCLNVHAAFSEEGAVSDSALAALTDELRRLAAWLDLERVVIGDRGDLAGALKPLAA